MIVHQQQKILICIFVHEKYQGVVGWVTGERISRGGGLPEKAGGILSETKVEASTFFTPCLAPTISRYPIGCAQKGGSGGGGWEAGGGGGAEAE